MSVLLSVSNLQKTYQTPAGAVSALDGVSFEVNEGETLAIVGESGCGKSTIAMTTLRLIDADAGEVMFREFDLFAVRGRSLRRARRNIGVVFQDPYSSLNPRMRVGDIIAEPLKIAGGTSRRQQAERVLSVLAEVGMGEEHVRRFPHQFSGGQRQRIAIARALVTEPDLIILDEPTAALDVSVQAQVLNLLKQLQQRRGIGYLFISHDLATVQFIADRVLVMYLGKVVEAGLMQSVFNHPQHPYTRGLLDAVPSLTEGSNHQLKALSGEIPSALKKPPGCPFVTRCDRAGDICGLEPPLLETGSAGRAAACHFPLYSESAHD